MNIQSLELSKRNRKQTAKSLRDLSNLRKTSNDKRPAADMDETEEE